MGALRTSPTDQTVTWRILARAFEKPLRVFEVGRKRGEAGSWGKLPAFVDGSGGKVRGYEERARGEGPDCSLRDREQAACQKEPVGTCSS